MLIAWAGGYWPLVGYIVLLSVISVVSIIPLREAAGVELSTLEESFVEEGSRGFARGAATR
jgi:MFS transporter, MHS family, shikimate and dehydroshikimate transport protein